MPHDFKRSRDHIRNVILFISLSGQEPAHIGRRLIEVHKEHAPGRSKHSKFASGDYSIEDENRGWWSVHGVEYWELLDEGTTVSADVYVRQLRELKANVQSSLRRRSHVYFQHDNVSTSTDRTSQDRPRPSCCRTVGPYFYTHRTPQTWPLQISTFSPTANATWTAKTSKLATRSRRHSATSSSSSFRPSGARASMICLYRGRRSSIKMEYISSESLLS